VIARLWRGWTAPADADEYERLLTDRILPGAAERDDGVAGYEVLRRDGDEEVAFVTVIHFDSFDAVEAFAGEEYERAHVPEPARELLSRWDDVAEHFRRSERWTR